MRMKGVDNRKELFSKRFAMLCHRTSCLQHQLILAGFPPFVKRFIQIRMKIHPSSTHNVMLEQEQEFQLVIL